MSKGFNGNYGLNFSTRARSSFLIFRMHGMDVFTLLREYKIIKKKYTGVSVFSFLVIRRR